MNATDIPINGEILLSCPVCGFDFTHVTDVSATMAQDAAPGRPDYEYRPSLEVRAYCENGGHHFIWRLYQHKGQTFLRALKIDGPRI